MLTSVVFIMEDEMAETTSPVVWRPRLRLSSALIWLLSKKTERPASAEISVTVSSSKDVH